ncbi:MAG: NADH-quinone oxidoreductase subunit NuoE [Bacteroidia bacterium]|nr:NADH-quinone oxidoreductase subunit NuoE [Bacteroidia bacterium]
MKNAIDSILNNFTSKEKGSLIPMLQAVQKEVKYISGEAVDKISKYLKISPSHIYGVATFYSQFKFNPPGRNSIKICLGTACHVQGGDFLLSTLKVQLNISPGETTEDLRYDLERVACLGCCAIAPVVSVNDEIHSKMSVIKLKEVLNKYE